MEMTMGKKVIGALMAAVLCLGMMPALALAPAGTAEAAELKAAEIKVPTANATKTTAKKKAKVTNLTTAYKNDELKLLMVDTKWSKNKNYNKTSKNYQSGMSWDEEKQVYVDKRKYISKSLTEYTGKALKPAMRMYIKNDKSKKTYTDPTISPEYRNESYYKITGYTQLKGVTITGKETKKQLAKKTKGKDFTVKYENNTALGTAQITIKGVNKYKGTLYQSFSIHLGEFKSLSKKAEQPVKAVASGKKALKVSWNKVKGAAGYVVRVTDDNNGITKSVLVSSKKKSVVVKGLESKHSYNVSVRAYASSTAGSYKYSRVAYDDSEWVNGYWDDKTNEWVDGYTKYKNKRVVINSHETYAQTVSTSADTLKPVKTK